MPQPRRSAIAARARLNWLAPSRARARESWASFESPYTVRGALWLCVPIPEERHDSLQLGIWDETIVGGCQYRHFAWDDPDGERFHATIWPDTLGASITEALDGWKARCVNTTSSSRRRTCDAVSPNV
jgi:hypothetical protein